MTDQDFINAVEKMAKKTKENASDFTGMDGATVANAMADALLLLVGILKQVVASIGLTMALTDRVKGDTAQLERLVDAWNRKQNDTATPS